MESSKDRDSLMMGQDTIERGGGSYKERARL